jgi:hypothetical protein
LVKLVQANDSDLCDFAQDLSHVRLAETVVFDNVSADITRLQNELEKIGATAKREADKLVARGEVQKITLDELKEQRTVIRSIDKVNQYNKADHVAGRTIMERFVMNAVLEVAEAAMLASETKLSYLNLLDYLCEDKEMAANDFFGTMRKFIDEFGKALNQVSDEVKTKRREEQRNATKSETSTQSNKLHARPQKADLAAIASLALTQKDRLKSQKVDERQHEVDLPAIASSATQQGRLSIPNVENKSAVANFSTNGREPHKIPVGIAAMAAAAAAKRKSISAINGRTESVSTVPVGGPRPARALSMSTALLVGDEVTSAAHLTRVPSNTDYRGGDMPKPPYKVPSREISAATALQESYPMHQEPAESAIVRGSHDSSKRKKYFNFW